MLFEGTGRLNAGGLLICRGKKKVICVEKKNIAEEKGAFQKTG